MIPAPGRDKARMIEKPVLIVGAPRSGTSLLQKIIRNHPSFWSMPSDSEIIWNRYCHPRLSDWHSEYKSAEDVTPEARQDIPRAFENLILPGSLWSRIQQEDIIWSSDRKSWFRPVTRELYKTVFPAIMSLIPKKRPRRLLEKSIGNCFRLSYVNEVFPDAKIIYTVRDGRNNVNSLINGWMNPNRFFNYKLPLELKMEGYPYDRWNFVLPPGWEEYVSRPLEEVCAFQWVSCHEFLLEETQLPKYEGRVYQVKLEDLSTHPGRYLRELTEFIEVTFDSYFVELSREMPVVNSPDQVVDQDKWKNQNREKVERILPIIKPMMCRLGYHL